MPRRVHFPGAGACVVENADRGRLMTECRGGKIRQSNAVQSRHVSRECYLLAFVIEHAGDAEADGLHIRGAAGGGGGNRFQNLRGARPMILSLGSPEDAAALKRRHFHARAADVYTKGEGVAHGAVSVSTRTGICAGKLRKGKLLAL